MAHRVVRQGNFAAKEKNKSGTEPLLVSQDRPEVNDFESAEPGNARIGCVFVVRDGRAGAGEAGPFCGLPSVAGSPYCARHRPLCIVSSASAAGRKLAADLAAAAESPEPPRELAHLQPRVLPEVEAEEQPAELRALLDHPPPPAEAELPE
jgi:hypothetical protein